MYFFAFNGIYCGIHVIYLYATVMIGNELELFCHFSMCESKLCYCFV